MTGFPAPLEALSDRVAYLPGAVNSVVVTGSGDRALVVDTGLDDTQARKLLRAVQAAGLTPAAILNTHSHADHHGGNAFLRRQLPDLPVYAPPVEAAVITHPLLEPVTLYGAAPPTELRGKFLLAPASPAQPVASGEQVLGGIPVTLIPVPGHALDMYAVQVGDVLYAADALFSPDALDKHPLTFCADSAAQKASAAALEGLAGVRVTLPGHGAPTGDLPALIRANLAAYERTTQAVLAAVQAGPAGMDALLARVCAALNITMVNPAAVLLNRAVVSAHVTELQQRGQVRLAVQDLHLTVHPA
ncbi:MBL fold metallo-hydrolase [Deinococcus ficus]|uniref:MBL fold metallo-hydrolase n=1 Tax=Deinococcus ficus TaxID=317577 RepID=A0A221SSX8_9DEIO|nr:MBL fold metallo-hydrolase [Deinococcus ficus]ASN79749.1 MBL fold metallo-hydrolase [Deinococcus ficus]